MADWEVIEQLGLNKETVCRAAYGLSSLGETWNEFNVVVPHRSANVETKCLFSIMKWELFGTRLYLWRSLKAYSGAGKGWLGLMFHMKDGTMEWVDTKKLQMHALPGSEPITIDSGLVESISLHVETGTGISEEAAFMPLRLVALLCLVPYMRYKSFGDLCLSARRTDDLPWNHPRMGDMVECAVPGHVELSFDMYVDPSLRFFPCPDGLLNGYQGGPPQGALSESRRYWGVSEAELMLSEETEKLMGRASSKNMILVFACGHGDAKCSVTYANSRHRGFTPDDEVFVAVTGATFREARLVSSMVFAALTEPAYGMSRLVTAMYAANSPHARPTGVDMVRANRRLLK